MSDLSWFFRKKQKNEMSVDPMDAEFFVESDDSSKLVREAIQNSLDARLSKNKPIKFRLQLIRNQKIAPTNQYTSGLEGHLQQTSPQNYNLIKEGMDYLVIEDFNTKGLQGDPSQYEDADSEGKNDFFYFWRNRGRSKKAEESRGRWGLGKLVFPHSSKINTFFGLTIRDDDKENYLMGTADLKVHQYQGHRYDSTAFYCKYEDDLQMPSNNPSEIEEFKRTFRLKRKDESGFSVVVTYPNETIQIQDLIVACVKHYYLPILTEELEIELSDGETEIVVNKKSLRVILDSLGEKGELISNRCDFVEWILSNGQNNLTALNFANAAGRSPQWSPELIPVEAIDELKEKFIGNERISIRVPLYLVKKNGKQYKTSFDMYLQKDPNLTNKSDVSFIREGLTISKVPVDKIRTKGIRAQILVTHPSLSEFLGDSENPAHTEWQQNQPKIKEKYELSNSTVLFVKNSINKIIEYLSPTIGGRDDTLLKDFFYFEKEHDIEKKKKKKAKKRKKKSGDASSSTDIKIDSKSKLGFKMLKYDDGFQILAKAEKSLPEEIRLKVAYDLSSGNAFHNYSEFDFRLDKLPIVVEIEEADVKYGIKDDLEGNQMVIKPKNVDFKVKVIGFDPKSNLLLEGRNK